MKEDPKRGRKLALGSGPPASPVLAISITETEERKGKEKWNKTSGQDKEEPAWLVPDALPHYVIPH